MAEQTGTIIGRKSRIDEKTGRALDIPIYSYGNLLEQTSTPDAPSTWRISGSGTGLGAGGQPLSPFQTMTKTTEPSTSTMTTEPSTTTTLFTPTQTRPTIGDVVRPNLPDAPTLPQYERPELAPVDPFVAPEYDEARVAELTQQAAAPGIRTLRQALRETTARRFDNPNVGALTMRKALEGYGTGLESILGGAAQTARGQYSEERAGELEEARVNYSQAVNDRNAIFNAEMTAESAEFNAALQNISQVYGAEVAAEMQTVADENAQNRAIFSASMDEYLTTGTRTTTTTGGKVTQTTTGGKVTQTTGPGKGGVASSASSGVSKGTLDYQQRVWDAKNAAIQTLGWNDPMRNLGIAQLGDRP